MKKLFLCFLFLFLTISTHGNATLYDRGGGLIYDDVLDITWLQDANYTWTSGCWRVNDGSREQSTMTVYQAQTWAANLVYYDSVRNVYWDDWRLASCLVGS